MYKNDALSLHSGGVQIVRLCIGTFFFFLTVIYVEESFRREKVKVCVIFSEAFRVNALSLSRTARSKFHLIDSCALITRDPRNWFAQPIQLANPIAAHRFRCNYKLVLSDTSYMKIARMIFLFHLT